ncbi:MAG: PqqD family peptide modification chaperone [Methanosarcinales archaeon]
MQLRNKYVTLQKKYTLYKSPTVRLIFDNHEVVSLNHIGVAILKLCNGLNTIEEIKEVFVKKYNVSRETLSYDIERFILEGINKGYLTICNEKIKNEMNFRDIDVNPPLMHVYWELTDKCNLICKHCYRYDGVVKEFNEFNFNDSKKMIDVFYSLGVCKIIFTGGEPLLNQNLLRIAEYVQSKKIDLILFTNGILINKEIAKKLKLLNFSFIRISLDGANEKSHEIIRGKNTFHKTIQGIRNCIDNDLNVEINTLIHKHNMNELFDLYKLCANLKVGKFRFTEFINEGRAKNNRELFETDSYVIEEQMKKINEFKRKFNLNTPIVGDVPIKKEMRLRYLTTKNENYCGIGITTCAIAADGDIVPCPLLNRKELRCGNIYIDDLKKVWESSNIFKKFREKYIVSQFEMCKECEYSPVCRGGCLAVSYATTGKMRPNQEMCQRIRGYYDKLHDRSK